MRSPIDHFDSETLALMGRACDDAWNELQKTISFPTQLDGRDVRRRLAARVLDAASRGERNPERLKSIALEEVKS